ncbi:MAG: c-type cytochrome [Lysobacterales bacterium]|jgi:cytochrome c553
MMIRMLFAIVFVSMLAAGPLYAGGDAAHGKELSVDCADCHGDDGMGDDETPAIAGMDEAEFVADLKGYKSGEKEDESGMMADYAADLSEQDMADLAAYYKSLGGN